MREKKYNFAQLIAKYTWNKRNNRFSRKRGLARKIPVHLYVPRLGTPRMRVLLTVDQKREWRMQREREERRNERNWTAAEVRNGASFNISGETIFRGFLRILHFLPKSIPESRYPSMGHVARGRAHKLRFRTRRVGNVYISLQPRWPATDANFRAVLSYEMHGEM